MRSAHTVEQVREAERELMAQLPDGALMQRAATGLAHAVLELLGRGYGARVLLLVGSGNNGGDALYAGAFLARRGVQVQALLLSPDSTHRGGLADLRAAGGRVVTSVEERRRPDVVVDGIIGIGGRGGLRPEAAALVESLADVPFVAVDTPSGVDSDTGRVEGPHVRAAVTVTFGTHKVAHLVDPAAMACGAVHLVDIGLDLPAPAVDRHAGGGCPRRCCRGRRRTRTSTRAAWSGCGPARSSTRAPGCCASPEPARASSGWCATSAERPTSCARSTPRSSSAPAGCRPG